MFVDSVALSISSGKGGAGCVSFRREKFVIQGGPDGGDGGKGGDVIFVVDRNCDTLSHFKGKKQLKASNGEQGYGRKKHGKNGEDLYIKVPLGTQIFNNDNGELLLDLKEENVNVKFLEGGKGGLGNWHFRSSTNQKPTYAQSGLEGVALNIRLELKLIADVGLVGFPNVGKSTLISVVSNARPEIANYEFTTLIPNLGVVDTDEYNSFVIADIPGIIEGASSGKGLGIQFLKHIERTKIFLFMIDLSRYTDIKEQYTVLRSELEKFSPELSNKDFAIALTKADSLTEDEINLKVAEFLQFLNLEISTTNHFAIESSNYYLDSEFFEFSKKVDISKPYFVLPISSSTHLNIKPLKFLLQAIKNEKNSN